MYTANKSKLKWVAIGIFILPVLAVVDAVTALYTFPAALLGSVIVTRVPVKVIVIAPRHIKEALEEYRLSDTSRISVYHKSSADFLEAVKAVDDLDAIKIDR